MTPASNDNHALTAVADFYDRLAPDYDAMTEFEKRFVREKPFFHLLADKYHLSTALDAGAGTGFHAILLARLGLSVTAVDISAEMLRRLEARAAAQRLPIRTLRSSFHRLRDHCTTPFDAIFCMGNSLAHLLSEDDLRKALIEFRGLLKPQGILLLQILNYDRILAARESVQGVREADGKVYTRSYNYRGSLIDFRITRDEKRTGTSPTWQEVSLRPILAAEMLRLLPEAGFLSVAPFGGIAMEAFEPERSIDLVVLARPGG